MDEPACPQCRSLRAQVAQRTAQVAELTRRLEEALRAGKRQAAPFRKGPPKPTPKTPGRKPGAAHGPHAHRRMESAMLVPDPYADYQAPEEAFAEGGCLVLRETRDPTRNAVRRSGASSRNMSGVALEHFVPVVHTVNSILTCVGEFSAPRIDCERRSIDRDRLMQ